MTLPIPEYTPPCEHFDYRLDGSIRKGYVLCNTCGELEHWEFMVMRHLKRIETLLASNGTRP